MAKFSKKQEAGYKETLSRARHLKREADALYSNYLKYDVHIPTMKELRKMNYTDALNLMNDLRLFRSPKDLVKKVRGADAFVSNLEDKIFRRRYKKSEEIRAERRKLLRVEEDPGLLGTEIEISTRPIKVDLDKIGNKEYEHVMRRVMNETSDVVQEEKRAAYIENYLKGIKNVFGEDIIESDEEIIGLLGQIPYELFDLITAKNTLLTLDFIYDEFIKLTDRYQAFYQELKKRTDEIKMSHQKEIEQIQKSWNEKMRRNKMK